jgi:hypothetical protein
MRGEPIKSSRKKKRKEIEINSSNAIFSPWRVAIYPGNHKRYQADNLVKCNEERHYSCS